MTPIKNYRIKNLDLFILIKMISYLEGGVNGAIFNFDTLDLLHKC
jgi:hypothetical protein